MQNAFILFKIPKYDRSLRIQSQNPKKVYGIDTGLLNTFIPDPMLDIGKKIENIVFLCIRRKNDKVYYLKNKYEIDFLIENKKGMQLINVCQNLKAAKTFEREIKGLVMGLKRFPKAEALLVANQTSSIDIPKPVQLAPLWKFLLEQ